MNADKTKTIRHKGVDFHLPYMVYQATASYMYSLLDYEAASRLCEGENVEPIIMFTAGNMKKAAGFIAVIDYQKTSLVPYLEWVLGVMVVSRSQKTPEVKYVNETSLLFQSILNDDRVGSSFLSPKMILSESLPTELGVEYYGIPKEVGQVQYDQNHQMVALSVATQEGPWIMKASHPQKSGTLERLGFFRSMVKAYGLRLLFQYMRQRHVVARLVGSAKILARMARVTSEKDPDTQMFSWGQGCRIEINPESDWGRVLLNLSFKPGIVCHLPNLKFEFSEPLEQIS